MSFLTPLYIAGIAAVSLPILFHMIRRMPRGRVPFSTIMFLNPSPPRMTRRSRLENWPLLLLRGLALTLLALAFARPFWRAVSGTDVNGENGRRIAVLLDTSASMRRGDLWRDAVKRAERIVAGASVNDEIGLFTFDRTLQSIVPFEEWSSLQPEARRKLAVNRLAEVAPGWAETRLGDALTNLAETLTAEDANQTDRQSGRDNEIVLISDLQSGSRTEPLGTYQWPAGLQLTLEQVTPSATTNAGLQLAAANSIDAANSTDAAREPDSQSPAPTPDAEAIRVWVLNAADSERETFGLRWAGDGPFFVDAAPIDVYVPAGGRHAVNVPLDPNLPVPARLVLTGDDHDFDNTIFVDRPSTQELTVLYVGGDKPDDPAGLRFYLERAFPDNHHRRVTVIGQQPDGPLISPVTREIGLVVVAERPTSDQLAAFRQYAEQGGCLLFVAASADVCRAFGELIGRPNLSVREADVEGYAMLGEVDFGHPLFVPFDDARFSDFTSIHFWKHRRLDDGELESCRVLARFDNGAPAVVAGPRDRGTAVLFTSGWHPADGQLALSTKFAPLMNALLELNAGRLDEGRYYRVGDPVPIARLANAAANPSLVRVPGDRAVRLTSGQRTFTETVVPGVYEFGESGSKQTPRFTVGLAPDESKTEPMPLEKLESLGVRVGAADTEATREAAAARRRQLKAIELESRQKIWRWLILSAVAALLLETWLAGRIAQRQVRVEVK